MPVLRIDVGGPDQMDIPLQRGGHAAPRKVGGDRGYSASGAECSQSRDELMVVPFVTAPLPWSQIATIRDLFALAARVNCAGDVFNKPGTIVCSGTITDELDQTGDRGIVTGTLFEIGSTTSYTPVTTLFLLTSVESPDSGGDPSILVSTPDGSYPGDASTGTTMGSGLTPPTASCPTVPGLAISSAPEATHLSVPLNAGIATGSPAIRIETGTVNGTVWDTSSVMAKLSLKRSGSIVAGPWDSSWGSMGVITGNTDFLTFSVTLVLPIQTGDQFVIEWYARIGLACGQTDNSQRPFVYFGGVPGPRQNPVLFIGGLLTSYP